MEHLGFKIEVEWLWNKDTQSRFEDSIMSHQHLPTFQPPIKVVERCNPINTLKSLKKRRVRGKDQGDTFYNMHLSCYLHNDKKHFQSRKLNKV